MTFVPTDIAGCKLWLDFSDADTLFTDAGSTKVSSDGQAIYQANDKSGNNYHAVQSTEASRPLYKTGIQNSKSVARFDGNNDYFVISSISVASGGKTLFICFYNNTNAGSVGRYLLDSQSGRLIFALYAAAGTAPFTNIGWYDGTWRAIAENTDKVWQIDTWKLESGGNGTVYQNGNSLGSAAYTDKAIGGITVISKAYNSSAAYIAGDIAEMILYDSALSEANRQAVETYLNNKWNIYATYDNLTASDLTLSPVTFAAPTLTNIVDDNLTASDLTLSPVTFAAPTLVNIVVAPTCRTCSVDAESRTYEIKAESRGLKITCNNTSSYAPSHTYNGLTAKDLTLTAPTFDAPVLASPWWLQGAVSPSNVVAAYQSKGVASYTASKANLADPGTYDLTESSDPPMWIKDRGWIVNNSSRYLKTGVLPAGKYSVIVLFNSYEKSVKAVQNTVLGAADTNYFEMFARRGSSGDDHLYYYGTTIGATGERLSGSYVMAMTPDAGYLDGIKEVDMPGDALNISNDIYIFTSNRGSLIPHLNGSVQALAIYDTVLTQEQVTAITNALKSLEATEYSLYPIDNNVGQGIFEWFQKPSAVRFVGTYDRTYISWINDEGKIQARYYDHSSDTYSATYDVDDLTDVNAVEAIDDHNPPNMYITETGQIQLRYCVHDVADSMFQKISTNVEDISSWGSRTTIADSASEVQNYPQVKKMTDGTLLLFYRRGPYNNSREYYKTSTDGGATWASPVELISHGPGYGIYAFVTSSGNEVHVAWNYQDASAGKRYDVYYMYSTDAGANWKKRDGTAITLPADPTNADLVFDSGADQDYVWDIRLDISNKPYIVFAYKEDPNHEFRYAKYSSGWTTSQITTSANLYEPSKHFYSGGVVIDPSDVNVVYLSKKRTHLEIEKWITADGGVNWTKSESITSDSNADNFRLQVVENYAAGHRLVWCSGAYFGETLDLNWTGYGDVFIRFEAD